MSTVEHPQASPAAVPIPFSRLVRVEARKSSDTRSGRRLLAATAVGLAVIPVVALVTTDDDVVTVSGFLGPMSSLLTLILPVVLILLVATEWSQRTMLTTFLQEPRRGRVLGAKVGWGFLVAVVAAVLALASAAGGVGAAAVLGERTSFDVTVVEAASFVLYVLLNGFVAMALAALLQHTLSAIVVFLTLPSFITMLTYGNDLAQWVDPSVTFAWVQDGAWEGHTANIAASVLLWVVLPGVLGVVRAVRREIR